MIRGENKMEMWQLRQFQALPLEVKILKSQQRIREWVEHFGIDGVYISFSGGKDSTVLLDLVRSVYSEVPAVFSDTGLEFPEIRDFVRSIDNVTWVKPKLTFSESGVETEIISTFIPASATFSNTLWAASPPCATA